MTWNSDEACCRYDANRAISQGFDLSMQPANAQIANVCKVQLLICPG